MSPCSHMLEKEIGRGVPIWAPHAEGDCTKLNTSCSLTRSKQTTHDTKSSLYKC